ncbi:MAG: SsrA-binding protein [Actinobacteria bacterium HGW-Actinobacteria-6]|jgi:SsrA-binding protein|nr:MAG: SsrA-binding protein [Actinobacteria bacterium HGW-Actinobacteria-6]
MPKEERLIANNKKAFHDYTVEETMEVGIALTGTEVKSLRESKASLRDAFASVKRGEVWLHNVHVSPYSHGNRGNVDPNRARKLLLHRNEIRYLIGKTKETGYTLVPLKMYFAPSGLVKLELALVRGKKAYDKRDALAAKDAKRDVARALKDRTLGR